MYAIRSYYGELKRIMKEMKVANVLLPDTSDVVDTPMTGKYEMYPKGGTTIPEMVSMGDSKHTLAIGSYATTLAAKNIDNKCKVPYTVEDLPIV